MVFYFEDDAKGNWQYITYKVNNEELFGYVYKNRLQNVSDFTLIPIYKQTKAEIVFKSKNTEVRFKLAEFTANKHKKTYYKNTNLVDKIDGEKAWGIDGNLPKTQYESIKLVVNDTEYNLPKAALFNLFEPNLELTNVYADTKTNSIYITATNGDGAGGYTFIMVIQSEVYKERLVLHPF